MSPSEEPNSIEEKVVRRKRRDEQPLSPEPANESAILLEKMTRRRKRHEERSEAKSPTDDSIGAQIPTTEEEKREQRDRRRRSQKSRPNVSEQNVHLADGQTVPESEVDAGLFESLMNTAADMGMGTLRRNKERRRSTKLRESSRKSADLMRSRTRENNVYEEEN